MAATGRLRDVPTPDFSGKRDVLVQHLRAAILSGEIPAGTRLRQEDIASQFGVSSTPVREAMRVLEAQGLVLHELHRGVTVANVTGRFNQIYRLRESLECLATEMATENMTPGRGRHLMELADRIDVATRAGDAEARREAHTQFHLVLYDGCDFPALVDMIQSVWIRFPWDELLALPGLHSSHDHDEIARLAAAADAAAADRLRQHLHAVRDALADALRVTRPAAEGSST